MKRLRINDNFSYKNILFVSAGTIIMVISAFTNIDNSNLWSNALLVWIERFVGLALIGIGITTIRSVI